MKDSPDIVDLFFGDDDNYVKLPATQGVEIGANGSTWTFGTDGNLTVPGDILSEGNINIDINLSDSTLRRWQFGEDGELTLPNGGHIGPSGGKGQGTTYGAANDHLVSLTSYYNSGLYSSCVTAYADGTLNITAYNDGGPNPAKIWTFDNTGTLTLPDDSGIKSSTNIDITIDTTDSSTFNWRFGADGGLQFPDATVQTTAWTGIPGPYADDEAAALAGVALGSPYHKTGTGGQVFVRLTSPT
jgi:hypothetical protein